jgi:FxsC-like protein
VRHFGLIHTRPEPGPEEGRHLPDDHVEELTRDLEARVRRLLPDHGAGIGTCCHVAHDDGHVPAVTDLLGLSAVVVVLGSAGYARSAVRRRVESAGKPVVEIDWVAPPDPPLGVVDLSRVGQHPYRRSLYDLFHSRDETGRFPREYHERLDEHAADIVRLVHEATRSRRPAPSAPRPPAVHVHRHLRFDLYLLAPTADRLPGDRDPYQYGPTVLDWHPYRHLSDRPLRWHLEARLGELGFQPVVVAGFNEGEAPLLRANDHPGPAALVLDPWALDDDHWRDALGRFDRRHQPWVGVVVTWNPDDPQTGAQAARLRARLDETLRQRWKGRRPALKVGAPIAADLLSLRVAFSTVVEHAAGQYLRYHPPHDP